MKPLHLAVLVGFFLALESAIPAWRNSAPVSDAPVWSLPMMEEPMKNPGDFQDSIDRYKADRGGELKLSGPDNTAVTLFYLQWDQLEAGPIIVIAGHSPELCNVAAGFTFENHLPNRIFHPAGAPGPLVFDVTVFKDTAGKPVHVYKNAWMQGLGTLDIRQLADRRARLVASLTRGRGVAHVLQAGIHGPASEDECWTIFQNQVLQKLAWK